MPHNNLQSEKRYFLRRVTDFIKEFNALIAALIVLIGTLGVFRDSIFPAKVETPDVVNKPIKEATEILESQELNYQINYVVVDSVNSDVVVIQKPEPNTKVKLGDEIILRVSKRKENEHKTESDRNYYLTGGGWIQLGAFKKGYWKTSNIKLSDYSIVPDKLEGSTVVIDINKINLRKTHPNRITSKLKEEDVIKHFFGEKGDSIHIKQVRMNIGLHKNVWANVDLYKNN
ncbi:PASTA domain-containing protein [Maribellus maritimus]|uniref:PASTA domain-containing protein n=1 Tax=Maribellus maritimus TaxID=2870838 RepID=UPI001EEAB3CC|nr:PASTA domain-containing protein [Maribellus maritimus]MCG6187448.1 PASTA domain-containing protein [Maribellus maritimus]